jgi:hypothetical protein
MPKFACIITAVVVLLAFTIATAKEYPGLIIKVEDSKITYWPGGKKANEKNLPIAANAMINKAKYYKDGKYVADGALDGGREALTKMVKEAADDPKKRKQPGVFAVIITEGTDVSEKVVELRVFQFMKKEKKDSGN